MISDALHDAIEMIEEYRDLAIYRDDPALYAWIESLKAQMNALRAYLDALPDEPIIAPKITWEKLVAIEPRLDELLKEIEAIKDPGGPSFCANDIWYRQYKPRFLKLVGWAAEKDDSVIKTEKAYNLAYKKLYHSLPDCRDCGCL